MKYQYHLIDNGGVSTEWDVPFKMAIGSMFHHEFGTYKVDEYKGDQILCERISQNKMQSTKVEVKGNYYEVIDCPPKKGDWFIFDNPVSGTKIVDKCLYFHNDGTIQPYQKGYLSMRKWKVEWCKLIVDSNDPLIPKNQRK